VGSIVGDIDPATGLGTNIADATFDANGLSDKLFRFRKQISEGYCGRTLKRFSESGPSLTGDSHSHGSKYQYNYADP
jgi:hypothetical protein